MGGCLGFHWETWQSWGFNAWVVRVSGPFSFAAASLLGAHPLPSYSPSSIRRLALANAVSDLMSKEAIEPAPPTPGYYSCLFVTPKVTGGWRPVIYLSRLNGFVDVSHFHMETTQSVLQSLRLGDWMVSLDLQGAYLQVPVHPASRRYLRAGVGFTSFAPFALACRRLLKFSPASRPRSPRSCIVTGSGFSGI